MIERLHRCFVERRTRWGWQAECSCGWKGRPCWHPLFAEREADKHATQPESPGTSGVGIDGAVELLAERLFRFNAMNRGSDSRWDEAPEPTKNGWRQDARSHLEAIRHLLTQPVPGNRGGVEEGLEALAATLQGWARTKRREAVEVVGEAEKLKLEWLAKGYDGAADLLLTVDSPAAPTERSS